MIRINLLPPDLRPQPQVRPLRILALLAMIVVAVGGTAGFVGAWTYRQSLKHDLEVIAQKRAEYGPLYDKVIGMEAALAQIEANLAGKEKLLSGLLDPVVVFQTMEGNVPENVGYLNFTVGANRDVNISGTASDYYGVAALMLKLSLAPQYGNVTLVRASGGEGSPVSFVITCTLRGGAPSS